MIANTIAFSQPVEKIYDVLLPPRSDLDDVLAILFTDPCCPNEDDFKLLAALNWLKLNHSDYSGVVISHENIAQYSEHEPPVTVLHRESDERTPAESMSVHEVDEERGTNEGHCPFAVHGLSTTDVATMSYKTRIATALQYFITVVLVKPESIYHNSALLPSMFLWLFPYGLGRLENSLIKARIGRGEHIRYLLTYIDRHSTRGGYLLTEHRNF
ncbi:uncharacterized protein LAESUDRAFT_737763 [Laetiporus sulphureus 93-53]|uniref:DUF6570 domain-containing protein n=1 Tax=Laetiporus sulphureus 93-53 TaxID=1314785 RepID=A0A165DJ96_9APHY|nr:uncharacterized protein LAESUDRAFT_737763 [Laetiporus sulphureus 93-53]KZT05004.1 hypothetical protein LAESUDRAFT_737763 [Laetiporus sulphureus 93-53]